MRRLLDPCGGTARQDILGAADAYAKSDEGDLSFEAWEAYQNAGKKGGNSLKKSGNGPRRTKQFKGDGRMMNGFSRVPGGAIAVTRVTVHIMWPLCVTGASLEANQSCRPSLS